MLPSADRFLLIILMSIFTSFAYANGHSCSFVFGGRGGELSLESFEDILPPKHDVKLSSKQEALLERYQEDFHHPIVGFQRYGEDYFSLPNSRNYDGAKEIGELKESTAKVERLFKKFPTYQGIVFRGVSLHRGFVGISWTSKFHYRNYISWLRSLKSGDTFTVNEFWSTSKSWEVAYNISSPSNPKVIFVIKSKTGRDLSNHAGQEHKLVDEKTDATEYIPSHEVILMPGKQYQVVESSPSSLKSVMKVFVIEEL